MKLRQGFVSNSSSSSFIVWKSNYYYSFLDYLTEEKAMDSIRKYVNSKDADVHVYEEFHRYFQDELKILESKEQVIHLIDEYCKFFDIGEISVAHVTIEHGGNAPSWKDTMVDWFRKDLFYENFTHIYEQ